MMACIPVDKHPKTGLSTSETVLTVLHAGGKFGGGGYKVSSDFMAWFERGQRAFN